MQLGTICSRPHAIQKTELGKKTPVRSSFFEEHLESEKNIQNRKSVLSFLPDLAEMIGLRERLTHIIEVKGFRCVEGRCIDAKWSVTRIGAKKAAPTFLTEEQLTQLFQAPDLRVPQGWRDLLLLRLFYDLGLRPSEVISLQIAEVDLQQQIPPCPSP